jgi:hypothetical protein
MIAAVKIAKLIHNNLRLAESADDDATPTPAVFVVAKEKRYRNINQSPIGAPESPSAYVAEQI